MRYQWVVFGLIGTLVCGLANGDDDLPTSSLIHRKSCTRFEVVLGRISGSNPRFRQTNTITEGADSDRIRESLSLQVSEGIPSLSYELTTPQAQISIDISDGNRVLLRRHPLQPGLTEVVYDQPAHGPLSLRVDGPQGQRDVTAQNLWELLLAEPTLCEEHLLPLAELIRPHWHLAERAEQVRIALCHVAESGQWPDRQELDQLMAQLASRHYHVRQAADRQLRAKGQAVLAYLDGLDLTSLDGEQRRRVQLIQRDLVRCGEDTPQRVATWMIDSPTVWQILLGSSDIERRKVAMRRLEQIGGQRSEGRGQRTEDRGQRAEDRGQRTEGRGQRAEDSGQSTEVVRHD